MNCRSLLLLTVSIVPFVGCSQGQLDADETLVSFSIALAEDHCGVVTADAMVSAADFSPAIGPLDLDVSGDTIVGRIPDVPVGTGRLIQVRAHNAEALVVYEGETLVDVIAGEPAVASVELYRNYDNCPDTVDPGTDPGTGEVVVDGSLNDGTPATDLAFVASEVAFSSNGILYFLDLEADRIHRYEISSGALLPPLVGSSQVATMAVAPDDSGAYLAYAGGRIDDFDLDTGAGAFFGAAPDNISSMVVTGGLLFTIDASGAWDTHSVYDRATGARLAFDEWRDTGRSFAWAPGMGRLFFLNSGVSPTDINYVDIDDVNGTLSEEVDSPYHGDYSLPNPIRLLPDESAIIVGSGLLFSTTDLSYQSAMGLSFTDVAFANDNYYLADSVGAMTQIRVLDAAFNILSAHYVDGAPRALFRHNDALVLVAEGSAPNTTRVRMIPLADL
ncbi:MAG: hypothetical protein AAF436_10205 [Myxococcota bacterium]